MDSEYIPRRSFALLLTMLFLFTCIPLSYLLYKTAASLFPYEFTFPKPEITVSISSSQNFTREQLEALPEIRNPEHSGFAHGAQKVEVIYSEEYTQKVIDIEQQTAVCSDGTQDCNQVLRAAKKYGRNTLAIVNVASIPPDGGTTEIHKYYALTSAQSPPYWTYLYTTSGMG